MRKDKNTPPTHTLLDEILFLYHFIIMFFQGKKITKEQWLANRTASLPLEQENVVDNFDQRLCHLKNEYEQKIIERAKRQAKIEEEKRVFEQNLESLESKLAVPIYSFENVTAAMERNDVETAQAQDFIENLPADDDLSTSEQQSIQYQLSSNYTLPSNDLLDLVPPQENKSLAHIEDSINRLQEVLYSYNFDGEVIDAVVGPRVTLYKIKVSVGIKVSELTRLTNDIMMGMEATSIRILAPVPGRNYAGIEIPNHTASLIRAKEIIESQSWNESRLIIPIILGKSISGEDIIFDLTKAPHLLIAGATGSGKSVCLNTIILSLLYKFSPEDLRLILIDPKVVEFAVYSDVPHLVTPIINDANAVGGILDWVINEMTLRYKILSKVKVRNISDFNNRNCLVETTIDNTLIPIKLPYMVVIIDELADIMMVAKKTVEQSLARIAQLSRAVGIHVIVATQRPSVNVITGIIKANFPTRIAFQVSSQTDSRTILDQKGAEQLLGRGDMLFNPPGEFGMMRIQAPLITDPEVERICNYVATQADQVFIEAIPKNTNNEDVVTDCSELDNSMESLVSQAISIIKKDNKASISYLQRRLRIGYNRAAMIMEILEERGIVGPQINSGPREILI